MATFPQATRVVVSSQFLFGRRLDGGNANTSRLQEDFSRLGFDFLALVKADHGKNGGRLKKLDLLNHWRNAIAHHDFNRKELNGKTQLSLTDVKQFRRACEGLAKTFDDVVGSEVAKLGGTPAW